jgi:hypothetical protein
MIHDFCKNEKVRQRKHALRQHHEPEESKMVHEDLGPDLDYAVQQDLGFVDVMENAHSGAGHPVG